jgi:hypothetical protein
MVHSGLLDLSMCEVQAELGLDEFRDAWDMAADTAGLPRSR